MGPEWAAGVSQNKRVKRTPKLRLGPTSADTSGVSNPTAQSETAAAGHNVFRPDIYRVSEGYLN